MKSERPLRNISGEAVVPAGGCHACMALATISVHMRVRVLKGSFVSLLMTCQS